MGAVPSNYGSPGRPGKSYPRPADGVRGSMPLINRPAHTWLHRCLSQAEPMVDSETGSSCGLVDGPWSGALVSVHVFVAKSRSNLLNRNRCDGGSPALALLANAS